MRWTTFEDGCSSCGYIINLRSESSTKLSSSQVFFDYQFSILTPSAGK
jgi:hypothetical protein